MIVSRWVPHNLIEAQKLAGVECCRDRINKFEVGSSRRVYDIMTGDDRYQSAVVEKHRSSPITECPGRYEGIHDFWPDDVFELFPASKTQ
ncbi:unnamed protein product [Arctia plantaginis]|uniref:Uncharacterized protein n=1 Tax=Arctia plantaginis TaxID=874455 RepID=A0A8S1AFP1_ARCPL|nr:unnamed protein product [Arctia plantaginis]CAB3253727.1 unnamed protein product [Arctia plantaginis]